MGTISNERIFAEGFIPPADSAPAPGTHELTRIIYGALRVMCMVGKRKKKPMPEKVNAMLDEIRATNGYIYERVKKYYNETSAAEVAFAFYGNRKWINDDGSLAIYHPQLDNPVLMRVVEGEQVKSDKIGRKLWLPDGRHSQVNLPE